MSSARALVLLPVYHGDRPEWLRDAIDSLLGQSIPVDILLGVDGPVPSVLSSVIDAMRLENPDFVVVREFAENRGLAATLNQMIVESLCLGGYEYIGRMDADDVSLSSRFEKQLALLDAKPEVGVCGAWCTEFDEFGREYEKRLPTSDSDLKRFMLLRAPFVHPSVVFRRSVLLEHRYPTDAPLVEDAAMWLRLATSGVQFANVGESLLRYRFSTQMMRRRGGMRRGLAEWRLRQATAVALAQRPSLRERMLSFGFFFLRLLPAWVNRVAYKWLR